MLLTLRCTKIDVTLYPVSKSHLCPPGDSKMTKKSPPNHAQLFWKECYILHNQRFLCDLEVLAYEVTNCYSDLGKMHHFTLSAE